MIKSVLALFVIAGVLTMSGCNTMKGAGQDMSAAGDKIENSAQKHKNY